MTAGLLAASPALAGDDYRSPESLPLDARTSFANPSLTANNEPLTTAAETCQGSFMEKTNWFSVVGDGLEITVDTDGSEPMPPGQYTRLDTMVAVYRFRPPPPNDVTGQPTRPTMDDLVKCNDDEDRAAGKITSRLSFPSESGRKYLIQVGVCSGCHFSNTDPTPTEGQVDLAVFSRPPNDAQAAATPLAINGSVSADNRWATLDPGEVPACEGGGKTVWFAYDAPRPGWINLSATAAFGVVVAVWRDGAQVSCVQKAGDSARARVAVTAGRYLLAVDGHGDDGSFALTTAFEPNYDLDGDKENVRPFGNDCNDANPAINSAAVDIYDNGVDENCDDRDAENPDHDGDGTLNADDCRPFDRTIHPGAIDVPENGINEDCRNGDAQYKTLPTSPRAFFVPGAGGFSVASILLRDVPRGARVELRCKAARGCRAKQKLVTRSLKKHRSQLRLPRITRGTLPGGSVVEVRVSKPGFVGRRFKWGPRMKQGLPVFTELCVKPNRPKPFKCQ